MERQKNRRKGRCVQISLLIAELQEIQRKFGDTCCYVTGLSWGSVALWDQHDAEGQTATGSRSFRESLCALWYFCISRALAETNGNATKAAELLDISRVYFVNKMRQLKIKGRGRGWATRAAAERSSAHRET